MIQPMSDSFFLWGDNCAFDILYFLSRQEYVFSSPVWARWRILE